MVKTVLKFITRQIIYDYNFLSSAEKKLIGNKSCRSCERINNTEVDDDDDG